MSREKVNARLIIFLDNCMVGALTNFFASIQDKRAYKGFTNGKSKKCTRIY